MFNHGYLAARQAQEAKTADYDLEVLSDRENQERR